MESQIKDKSLANQGRLNIELAERNMGALLKVKERFESEKPFNGLKIGLALHVTKETAVLVKTLRAGGANVAITGCNPLSTQDDVAASLVQDYGISVFAKKGEDRETFFKHLHAAIAHHPSVTMDDGADLISTIHREFPKQAKEIIGSMEETTTGVIRLRAMAKD